MQKDTNTLEDALFRRQKNSVETYGSYPSDNVSLPGFTSYCNLRESPQEVECIRDKVMYLLFETALRGGSYGLYVPNNI